MIRHDIRSKTSEQPGKMRNWTGYQRQSNGEEGEVGSVRQVRVGDNQTQVRTIMLIRDQGRKRETEGGHIQTDSTRQK